MSVIQNFYQEDSAFCLESRHGTSGMLGNIYSLQCSLISNSLVRWNLGKDENPVSKTSFVPKALHQPFINPETTNVVRTIQVQRSSTSTCWRGYRTIVQGELRTKHINLLVRDLYGKCPSTISPGQSLRFPYFVSLFCHWSVHRWPLPSEPMHCAL
jgi:hypothetical protein